MVVEIRALKGLVFFFLQLSLSWISAFQKAAREYRCWELQMSERRLLRVSFNQEVAFSMLTELALG